MFILSVTLFCTPYRSNHKNHKNMKFLGEMYNNLPKSYYKQIYTSVLNHVNNHCRQYYNVLIQPQ